MMLKVGSFAHLQCCKVLIIKWGLYLTILPAPAFYICVADDKENSCIDMFGSPAYGHIGFHDAYYYGTIDGVHYKCGQFQSECSICAACAGNCLEEYHAAYCEDI